MRISMRYSTANIGSALPAEEIVFVLHVSDPGQSAMKVEKEEKTVYLSTLLGTVEPKWKELTHQTHSPAVAQASLFQVK
jgi:hypothetical protein